MTKSVPAVITAGGRISGEFAASTGTNIKALVPLDGAFMVERVVTALRDSGSVIEPIIIVGPVAELQRSKGLGSSRLIAEAQTGPENMVCGLSVVSESGTDGWAILCTCDLPLLTGEAICWLLDNAPDDADIVFPILTKAEFEAAFPQSPGTYAPIERGQYTGGSVFLVRPATFSRNLPLIERVFAARKGIFSMARLGGFGLLARLLTGTLTIEYVEARASKLTGCRCRAVRHAPPVLAADVDTMEDYRFILSQLAVSGVRA